MKTFSLLFIFLFSLSLFAQSEQIQEANEIWSDWQRLQAQGVQTRDLYAGQSERESLIISGIPKYVESMETKGVVFRHYVGKAMPIILESSQLKTGITPYVVLKPGFGKEVYEDLVGIFLTTPQTPPEKVGLPASADDYIDLEVYSGTPVVKIESAIFLIPGRPDVPEWLKTLYLNYKVTGKAEPYYRDTFERIDRRGGVNPTFMKIKIKRFRYQGKTVVL